MGNFEKIMRKTRRQVAQAIKRFRGQFNISRISSWLRGFDRVYVEIKNKHQELEFEHERVLGACYFIAEDLRKLSPRAFERSVVEIVDTAFYDVDMYIATSMENEANDTI